MKYYIGIDLGRTNLAGSGKGLESVIMITLGTGVGAGIVLDNKIYDGINYAAGEIGHMVIAL